MNFQLSTYGLTAHQVSQLSVELSKKLELPIGQLQGIKPYISISNAPADVTPVLSIERTKYLMPAEQKRIREQAEETIADFMLLIENRKEE